MRVYALSALCLLLAGSAHAERIRDMSMPLGESLAQPDIDNSSNRYGGNNSNQPGTLLPYPDERQGQLNPPDDSTTSNRFMDNFCNPNKRSAIADNPRMRDIQSCLDSNKEQTCSKFASLPADAKVMLEAQIICAMELAENTDEDAPKQKDCSRFDSQRIDLLKKYEQDQQTTWAILHLPDEVVFGPNRCISGQPR